MKLQANEWRRIIFETFRLATMCLQGFVSFLFKRNEWILKAASMARDSWCSIDTCQSLVIEPNEDFHWSPDQDIQPETIWLLVAEAYNHIRLDS